MKKAVKSDLSKFSTFGGELGAPQGPKLDRDIFRMCLPYSSTDSGRMKKFLSPDLIEKNVLLVFCSFFVFWATFPPI